MTLNLKVKFPIVVVLVYLFHRNEIRIEKQAHGKTTEGSTSTVHETEVHFFFKILFADR